MSAAELRRRFLFAVLALAAMLAPAARAAWQLQWNGAGWYQESIFGLYAGPWDSAAACKATLPNDADFEFECNYYDQKPAWNRPNPRVAKAPAAVAPVAAKPPAGNPAKPAAPSPLAEQQGYCDDSAAAADLRIGGCTSVIQSGKLGAKKLALAFRQRGMAYAEKTQHDDAIKDYDQALKLRPDFGDALASRGDAYKAKGEYDRALQDYEGAVRLEPEKRAFLLDRGIAQDEGGRFDSAIADFDHVLRNAPKDVPALLYRCWAKVHAGKTAEGLADCNRGADLAKGAYPVLVFRGFAYFANGDPAYALADFDAALKMKINLAHPYVHYGRGIVLEAQGNAASAQAEFAIAQKLSPNSNLGRHMHSFDRFRKRTPRPPS